MGSSEKKKGERPEWWARDVRCPTSTCKAVLMVVASMVRPKTNDCEPGNKYLAERAACSEKSVERALDWIEGEGLMDREARYKDHRHREPDRLTLHWREPIPDHLDLRKEAELTDTMSGSNGATYPTLCPDLTDSVSGPNRHGVGIVSKPLKQAIEEGDVACDPAPTPSAPFGPKALREDQLAPLVDPEPTHAREGDSETDAILDKYFPRRGKEATTPDTQPPPSPRQPNQNPLAVQTDEVKALAAEIAAITGLGEISAYETFRRFDGDTKMAVLDAKHRGQPTRDLLIDALRIVGAIGGTA